MNSQEYHSLQEAYMNVYQEVDEAVYGGEQKKPEAPKKVDDRMVVTNADKKGNTPAYQNLMKGDKRYKAADHMGEATAMSKRGYDEAPIRNKIASQTRGGEFADKATKLADRETYGDKKKKAGREKLARAQRGTFRNTTSSSPGLRGYGHKATTDADKAKQSARGAQRSALTPNERKQLNMEFDLYDVILEYLISEGYADTNENALVIMANMSEEWRDSIVEVTGGGKVEYKPRFTDSTGPRVYPQTTQDPEKRGMSSYPSTKTADKINQLNYQKSKIPTESEKRKKLETRVSKLQSRFNRDGKEDQDYVSK